MGPFMSPFNNLLCMLLGISFTVWFTLLLVFIIVPAIFGLSFGIRRLYMKTLLKVFEWATVRMERGAKEKNHLLYKPYSLNSTCVSGCVNTVHCYTCGKMICCSCCMTFDLFTTNSHCSASPATIYTLCSQTPLFVFLWDSENKPKNGGICVANHTSPIDVIILASDGCYAMVGQIHGGLMGLIQRSMVKACPHIWFERSEVKDRHLVAKRLSDHVKDKSKLPILIFPEGTCINNTSVMMFKKGSFEIGSTVYPVAIKYDPRFGEAFWNSSKFGMVNYLLRMMSSWAIVCSVWYLPPMSRQEGEDAVQFANRVKAAIARQGGLVDLLWDGGLKRGKVKDTFKEEQQKLYSKILVGTQEVRSRS
ncbi:glycerol-3-phosphate acyltransferase 4-like [Sinocyclocheilus rhinocerous]|uniref:Glycerol-3-phosphate acyltransferase 4-like n=1 Tax=Sinocyclocheilus rhinocerous TaxID=307959 RepID=A0A673LMP4_9TELE|nr:PREDICTED: glycerol-3-phosphate acyltransferase 4-like [Sinocyclocheilus rhinocerous]